jgi:hypothetical protein
MLTNQRIYARFMDKVVHEPSCGCWIWIGSGCPGYGSIKVEGKNCPAHHLSFAHYKGPIPEGLELDHICRLKCCVNPDHLRAVTRKQNIILAQPFRRRKFKPYSPPSSPRLAAAIDAMGTVRALAKAIGLTPQAVHAWHEIPPERVRAVSQATGIPGHVLRPDVWGLPMDRAS